MVALWQYGRTGEPTREEVNSRTVTDAQIQDADTIVVSYTSKKTGVTQYRQIHGAMGRDQLADIITHVTRIVSPTRKGRR